VTDRPILFSAPMVRALLDGRKTQTRRVLNPQPGPDIDNAGDGETIIDMATGKEIRMRFAVGDRLWVKETWRANYGLDFYDDELGRCPRPSDMDPKHTAIEYLADGELELGGKTRVSIHMPRWASRLTLLVTEVRVERLQDCSREDAIAEGIQRVGGGMLRWENWSGAEGQSGTSPQAAYALLWNSINGAGAWDANPWVVAITFSVEKRNIDQ
jgi:hypothetical protein